LKGKIMKAKKYTEVNELYQKGLRYYEANEFNKARGTLQMIEADFEKYEEIKDLLEKIDQIPAVEVSYSMANDHFKAGDLDKTKEMLYSILKMIPVYKKALDLKSLIEEMEQLIKAMNEAETRKDPQAVIEALKKILEKVPNPDNYYNQFAYKKMKDLTTGKNLRAELNYVSGIEAMAQWKYAAAYEYFKKAYASDPDSVKIKIALSESKQKRLKILQTCYPASLIVEKENPAKAKILWKKIIDLGPEGNEYYEKAIKKLEG
ncbi:MAG: hypothetical protein JW774_03340, partial [Candidatus Aureabacteria bacterium]|nr:hypothetical protein [Candidatus Auribacterota bacterium]